MEQVGALEAVDELGFVFDGEVEVDGILDDSVFLGQLFRVGREHKDLVDVSLVHVVGFEDEGEPVVFDDW
jgi:hypothetical protein